MAGRLAAKLPSPSCEVHWITNDELFLLAPTDDDSRSSILYSIRCQVLNVKDGSLDQLAKLNNWIDATESAVGRGLLEVADAHSPQQKQRFK